MKKRIAIALFVFYMCFNLIGCDAEIKAGKGAKGYEDNTFLEPIPHTDCLYYDPQTKIVYFLFSEAFTYGGYGYMSPYYASNGLPYLYDPSTQELIKNSTKEG